MGRRTIARSTIELVRGDITQQDTDAIVNAANTTLLGGGGVDGAIHRAGGPAILEECKALGGCATGDAKVTRGGRLRARWVIHAVGPVYRDGRHGEAELLAGCYRKCMELADERAVRTISFPAISTGIYGYPQKAAAEIAIREVQRHLARPDTAVEQVIFVLFGAAAHEVYRKILAADIPTGPPAARI